MCTMNIKVICGLTFACWCTATWADPFYTGNPYSPYPPGCVTVPQKQTELYGDNAYRFFSGNMQLDVVSLIDLEPPTNLGGKVRVNMYRVACAEPNRSVILAEFKLPAQWSDSGLSQIVLPHLHGMITESGVAFEFKSEPHGWTQNLQQQSLTRSSLGDYTGGWDDARRFSWWYIVDVGRRSAWLEWDDIAKQYNEEFDLQFYREGRLARTIRVPSTQSVLQANSSLPLNGRLSGNWVEQGSADQGFTLSFSNPVPRSIAGAVEPESSDLSVFLSWFTFDADGKQLWLTGSADFPQGSTEVDIPVERVTGGGFMAGSSADRAVVGSARLKAYQCNKLELRYDLESLGLDAGEVQLERLDSLEIAGYPCRDYWARLESLQPSR